MSEFSMIGMVTKKYSQYPNDGNRLHRRSSASKFREKYDDIRHARYLVNNATTIYRILLPTKKSKPTSYMLYQHSYNIGTTLLNSYKTTKTFNNLKDDHNPISTFNHPKIKALYSTTMLIRRHTPPEDKSISRPNSAGIDCPLDMYNYYEFLLQKSYNIHHNPKNINQYNSNNQIKILYVSYITNSILTAYWKRVNIFVSLIPLERNYNIIFDHANILPVYGYMSINYQRYIISDQYGKSSLRNLLDDFGPFDYFLTLRYLKQIANGLQAMHYYKVAHNRLTLYNILYNKDGQLFINIIKSTSRPPTYREKKNCLHYFPPYLLFSKTTSKSLKSDVWALGCIAIEMLTGCQLSYSPYHPYSSFYTNELTPSYQTIMDNIKQLHNDSMTKKYSIKQWYKTNKIILSYQASIFINKCLQLRAEMRANISDIINSEYFYRV